MRDGVAIDTSFGMSPQSGLPQNNRAGDVDAFAVLHMMKALSLDADGMARVLASQSGLAGLSGTSGEVPDLERAAAAGDARPASRSTCSCAPCGTTSGRSSSSWAGSTS